MDTTAAKDAATVGSTSTLASVQAQLTRIEQELALEVLEREAAIRAVLVAFLAQEHLVFLGPPGAAKTDLIRRAASRFCDPSGNGLSYFFALLTRFTKPEELLGPLDIPALKAGEYRYLTARKLPTAQIVFLSEIFKCSSAILNTLLMILNERLFDDGTGMKSVPLLSLFGDSNEMPQGEDLEALWDRLLLRLYVSYLSPSGFSTLIKAVVNQVQATGGQMPRTVMSQADLALLQSHAAALPMSSGVIDAMSDLRKQLQDKGIVASDRRYVQSLRIIRSHAVIEGKPEVDEDDLAILAHVLWATPEQRSDITKVVNKLSNPTNAKAVELKDHAQEILDQTRSAMQANAQDETKRMLAAAEGSGKLKKVLEEMKELHKQAGISGKKTKRIDQAKVAIEQMYTELLKDVGFSIGV